MADFFFLQEEERGSGIRAWFKVLLYEGSLVPPDSGEPPGRQRLSSEHQGALTRKAPAGHSHRPWAFDSSECHPSASNRPLKPSPEARPSHPGPQLSWNLPHPACHCTHSSGRGLVASPAVCAGHVASQKKGDPLQ